jgi:predicted PurR-regulated permease PerM
VAKVASLPNWQRAVIVLAGTVISVVVVACLYWAQLVFIPVALAIYLTFLLTPLVGVFQRLRLGRVFSIVLAVFLVGLLLGGVGWMVAQQVSSLLKGLPQYSENIKEKIKSLRTTDEGSPRQAVERMVREVSGELESPPPGKELSEGPADPSARPKAPGMEKPPAVVVQPESPSWLARLPSFLGSVAESLGGLGLTFVLILFMLLKREDLRNRLIRLVGHGRLTVTTKAVDDAGQRISRFLFMQAVLNGTFGLALAVGLFLIGVEYAFLWGFLAAVLRYVPYIGTWIAALLPVTLSLGAFEGWLQPLLVIGLFVILEVIWYNILEPRLFGHSMGVSEVALLVSAAFWAFLWGPIGLFLSNPLTVCLVVLGKYVPQLEFFDVILGDGPPLEDHVSFYQRLLARDQDEAAQMAEARGRTSEEVYDDLLIPALTFAKQDRERNELTDRDEEFILQATQEIVEDLGERPMMTSLANGADNQKERAIDLPKASIFGYPAREKGDQIALEMLQRLLDPDKWDMEVASVDLLSSEMVALAAEKKPAIICIGSLPPGGLAHTRYLCKRLRSQLPDTKIVVGRWGLQANLEQNRKQLAEVGAQQVETTLLATRNQLTAWLPTLAAKTQAISADGSGSNRLALR